MDDDDYVTPVPDPNEITCAQFMDLFVEKMFGDTRLEYGLKGVTIGGRRFSDFINEYLALRGEMVVPIPDEKT